MIKAELGAVPQFPFQEILNQFTLVGTCIVINEAHASRSVADLLFSVLVSQCAFFVSLEGHSFY